MLKARPGSVDEDDATSELNSLTLTPFLSVWVDKVCRDLSVRLIEVVMRVPAIF